MANINPSSSKRSNVCNVCYEVETLTRFRRVPRARVLEETRERERDCREHTLMLVDDRHIECEECGAEWKDEGF